MSERKLRYACAGLYSVEAHNVVHAGLLLGLQIARRRHGPMARCCRLDLRGSIRQTGLLSKLLAGFRREANRINSQSLLIASRKKGVNLCKAARTALAHVAPVRLTKKTTQGALSERRIASR